MATEEKDATTHQAEAAEAPAGTEHGERTGMKDLVEDLHERREKAKLGGGPEKIKVQHERGKLTARERIDLLVDPGTFVEIGIQAGPHSSQRAMEGKEAPADGVITGWGNVDGRPCCIAAYDFTVMAGSMGMTGELKVSRLREMALQKRPPVRETSDPEDRMSERLLDIVPESARHPYDMYDVISEIVDDGEYFDIKPKFAKTLITCFARFGGQPVGIVAN